MDRPEYNLLVMYSFLYSFLSILDFEFIDDQEVYGVCVCTLLDEYRFWNLQFS